MPTPDSAKRKRTVDLDLIRCARQPGNLRITRHACALRYLCSINTELDLTRNEFEMTRNSGLARCRSCPMGRLYAKDLQPSDVQASE